ncbi:MAG: hypothetical protein ACUVWR_03455 [Anaerolineae bacterium]
MSRLVLVILNLLAAGLLAWVIRAIYKSLDESWADLGLAVGFVAGAIYALGASAWRWSFWLALAAVLLVALLPVLLGRGAAFVITFIRRLWPSAINRARRRGEVRALLRLYFQAHRLDDALDLVKASLVYPPYFPLRDELVHGTIQVYGLRSGMAVVRQVGLPVAIVERAEQSLELTSEAVWGSAERVVAAAAQGVETARLRQARERELDKLTRLSEAIIAAREGLVELTLARGNVEGDLAYAEAQLKALGEAARELAEQWD